MIKLYQFPSYFGLPNASPFCLKVETWLRILDLPYQTVDMPDPRKAPKGKLPYIDDGGTLVADSHTIATYLDGKQGGKSEAHLSDSERAVALSMRVMLEEHLYWAMVYSRFIDDKNWPATSKEFFKALPAVVRLVLPSIFRKQVKKDLRGHGMGRHSQAEIYGLAVDDLTALSAYLGDKPYFTGDRPVELDASAYGFLAQIYWTPSNPDIKKAIAALKNLEAFAERMRTRYFAAASSR